jgi:hypothetical protein
MKIDRQVIGMLGTLPLIATPFRVGFGPGN